MPEHSEEETMQPNMKQSRTRWSYGRSHVVLVGLTLSLAAVACGVPMETEQAAQMERMGQANHMGAAAPGDATALPGDVKAPDASTADDAPVGDAAKGKANFAACAACHGPDGKGVPSLGKN
ncbi:MAG: c-type cytochrome, partial [Ardenticatenales bacterium]